MPHRSAAAGRRASTPTMSASTPQERLRIALDMADTGIELMRSRLRREHPEWSDDDVEAELHRWLHHRPHAPYGDYPGKLSSRRLGNAPP